MLLFLCKYTICEIFFGSLIISNDSHLISIFDLLLTFPENTDLHVCFTCEEMDLQEDKKKAKVQEFWQLL